MRMICANEPASADDLQGAYPLCCSLNNAPYIFCQLRICEALNDTVMPSSIRGCGSVQCRPLVKQVGAFFWQF